MNQSKEIDYTLFRSNYPSEVLDDAERELKVIKESVSFGAGLYSIGERVFDLIQVLKLEMFKILSEFGDINLRNNPYSESSFILAKMYYEKGYKEEGDECKEVAITFDPNNESYK
jgi:hypothetical protein